MVRKLRYCAIAVLVGAAWLASAAGPVQAEPNHLTADEQAHGWKLLFDGKTTTGWRGMKGTPFPSQTWTIEDNAIRTKEDNSGGDLATEKVFNNFELEVEWKISPGGNSGIKYLVQDEWLSPHFQPDLSAKEKHAQWLAAVGPEYQIYDDEKMAHHPGWEKSSTGALYLLYAPKDRHLNPPGQWNVARIVVRGNHVEHWLNGGKLLECELGSPELLALVEKTKFRKVPGYGIKGPGRIVLQHHGSPVWFRNIKIRELPAD
jgi:3-keto-disaccharide hydrolase